jgi:hypothetical protein
MRQYIDMVEARRPRVAPPPIDTSGYAAEITTLMRAFATYPCHMHFKRDWADMARQRLLSRKAQEMAAHQRDADRQDDPEPFLFDMADNLSEIVTAVWNHARSVFSRVKASVEHEHHHDYQQRAAERHDRLDDPDFYIESSDYLSGMHEMVECAEDLYRSSPADPASARQIIDRCHTFIKTWERYEQPSDGGEAPIIDEDFATGIENLLPLMLFRFAGR